jgi:hypothetical protein
MDERTENIRDAPARRVFEVIVDFSDFGPVSPELVAWELDVDPSRIERAWSDVAAAGLIEPCGTVRASGEEGWRLTAHGRREAARERRIAGRSDPGAPTGNRPQ